MKIGIPLEIMTGEGRIALTPEACSSIVKNGHSVYLQHSAGAVSGYTDLEYQNCGVVIVETAEQLYESAQLIVKVKQPLAQDLHYLHKNHVLFSYLHLAADVSLIRSLCAIGLSAIPFESIVDDNGLLPLLAPMSQVAGRISVIRGASLLFRNRGGRGVLLGGVDGADIGRVVILGAGVAGSHAVAIATALGARVDVLDLNEMRLSELKQQYPAIETHLSNAERIETLCVQADLVIGAVLLAGRRAPVILKQSVVKQMNHGSVIVDIAIDQGGCVEDIRSTSSEELCYLHNGVIHSAVPNMPAAVARTASQSLSTAILPYVLALAEADSEHLQDSKAQLAGVLQDAMAIQQHKVVDTVLAQELDAEDELAEDVDSIV
ncbi:MAG: alanine dehydrogenase [Proteobacteria bacterium]|nr:alanine dehydrogenase [Pseudomonadota bacterium]